MRSGALPVLAWAAFLTLLTAVLLAWTPDAELQWGPFAAATLLAWGIGLWLLARGRVRPFGRVPALSGAALLAAVGVVLCAQALVFGWWLALIGGALLLASAALVAREAR